MLNRVARYRSLRGYDGVLADSNMPDAVRFLFNVIGFQPPPNESGGAGSPVGARAARMSSIKISEGFNLGYCEALPGRGPMMHNHDTNETFITMTGKWRASWELENGEVEHVDLGPLDVISFPPGAVRLPVELHGAGGLRGLPHQHGEREWLAQCPSGPRF